jgi:multidrug efflux pump subunit AcrA (membrane-fusion protein)
MDRKIARKPLWFRYRWQLIGGTLVTALIVYMLIASAGGQKLRVELDNIITAEARRDRFLEYLDVEGVVQPMMSVKVNTLEGGRVERIVAEGGAMVEQGDTILVLTNTELMRTIDDERDAWERQRITFRQREIEMEQKSIDLQQQSLRNA